MLGKRRFLARAVVVALMLAGMSVVQSAAASAEAPNSEAGAFVSLAPSRVLDTRSGNGASGPVGPNRTVSVQITGRGGVPTSGVSAVVLNVTETGASQPGFITVYPNGALLPT